MIKPVPKPCRDPSRPANEMTTTDGRTFAVTSFTLSAAGSSASALAIKNALATIPNSWRGIETRLRLRFCFCFGLFCLGFGLRLLRFNAQGSQRPFGDALYILTGIGGCFFERADRRPRKGTELFERRHRLNTNGILWIVHRSQDDRQPFVNLPQCAQRAGCRDSRCGRRVVHQSFEPANASGVRPNGRSDALGVHSQCLSAPIPHRRVSIADELLRDTIECCVLTFAWATSGDLSNRPSGFNAALRLR